jgi:hypothetical protein
MEKVDHGWFTHSTHWFFAQVCVRKLLRLTNFGSLRTLVQLFEIKARGVCLLALTMQLEMKFALTPALSPRLPGAQERENRLVALEAITVR